MLNFENISIWNLSSMQCIGTCECKQLCNWICYGRKEEFDLEFNFYQYISNCLLRNIKYTIYLFIQKWHKSLIYDAGILLDIMEN